MCLILSWWNLPYRVRRGPIYRTGSSTTRLAAINGCHELVRGKKIYMLWRFSKQFCFENKLSRAKKLRICAQGVPMWSAIMGIKFHRRVFKIFFKTLDSIQFLNDACWNQIWALMDCSPCHFWFSIIYLMENQKKLKEIRAQMEGNELGNAEKDREWGRRWRAGACVARANR